MHPALILVANDQEWSARSIESVLAPSGYAILRAFTGQQALDRARASRPDLLILDAQLPDIHGFDVCRTLREDPAIGHAVPIIITTAGPSGRQKRIEAIQAGAWDFLGHPLDAQLMLAKIETYLNAIGEMRRQREEGLLDDETGLYSSRGLSRRLREVVSEAARRKAPMACVVMKPVVERGDAPTVAALAGLGDALRRLGRASDVLGRLADDEFVVIAPATDAAAAARLVERVLAGLEPELATYGMSLRTGTSVLEPGGESRLDDQELLALTVERARLN